MSRYQKSEIESLKKQEKITVSQVILVNFMHFEWLTIIHRVIKSTEGGIADHALEVI